MLEKLELIYQRWKAVEGELSSPDAMADMKRFAQLNREYKELGKIVEEYHIYRNIMSNIDTNKEILATEKDQEFREMAQTENWTSYWKSDEKGRRDQPDADP
jgi:peptide chain release factor 1